MRYWHPGMICWRHGCIGGRDSVGHEGDVSAPRVDHHDVIESDAHTRAVGLIPFMLLGNIMQDFVDRTRVSGKQFIHIAICLILAWVKMLLLKLFPHSLHHPLIPMTSRCIDCG